MILIFKKCGLYRYVRITKYIQVTSLVQCPLYTLLYILILAIQLYDVVLLLDIKSVLGRELLGQKVARNVFSWHPSEKHLVYGLFKRHIGTLQPKKVPKPKTCPIPRKQLISHYVILNCIKTKMDGIF